jgi:hypothetical protein
VHPGIRDTWLSLLLSTAPADRPRAESALCDVYTYAMPDRTNGLPKPVHFFWFDSPAQAAWAVLALKAAHDDLTRSLLEDIGRLKRGREILEQTRAALCQSAQKEWAELTATVGEKLWVARSIRVIFARVELYKNGFDAIPDRNDSDILSAADASFRDVVSGQADEYCTLNPVIGASFYHDYSFAEMAEDESAALERETPPLLAACWNVANSAGLWWPFRGAVVLSERPVEMQLKVSRLHCEDGPAARYRDGSLLWAWNGHPMQEEWILHPETIPRSTLKCLDRTFQAHVKARIPAPKRTAKLKPSAMLEQELPAASVERIKLLHRHNHGRLPLFDRYMDGDCRKVWEELIALGPAVRQNPYAADALAVAYETMSRVRTNVRTITARLEALAYEKADGPLYQAPGAGTRKLIARLEKKAGALPLSLRAFYDVVGAVDWTGHHPSIAPRDHPVTPDPLVVFPIEIALEHSEESALVIAPDEIFKAGAAGGDSFKMEVPNLAADGKLINENHDTYFVEYLRIAFRFGGFPGYDGLEPVPIELADLAQGLVVF